MTSDWTQMKYKIVIVLTKLYNLFNYLISLTLKYDGKLIS
jgi:hypothetical protein